MYPPTMLIDAPRAGMLPRHEAAFDLQVIPDGGVLVTAGAGIFSNFFINISYGGGNIIGTGDVQWNPHIGYEARIRILNESMVTPAIAIGFSSQGYGVYNKEFARYGFKSKGFYIVGSRNYELWGNLGVHLGANYSLEQSDGDEDPSIFAGIDKTLFFRHEFFAEYDFALNDNEKDAFGDGKGYLNAGIRFNFYENIAVDFLMKDILDNNNEISTGWRGIRISYKMKIKFR